MSATTDATHDSGSSRAVDRAPQRSSVIVPVGDLSPVVDFYRDRLGLDVMSSWDEPSGAGAIIALTRLSSIEFVQMPGVRNRRPPSDVAIMLGVEDAVRWRDDLRAAGVPVVRELVDNPWGDRSFGIDDPAGHRVWIFEDR